MANVKKELRVDDTEIKKLNHLGLGLRAIGKRLGCHSATVTIRLREMGVRPSDTRRNFMEDVFNSLTPDEQEWLAENLYGSGIPVKTFVTEMLKEAYRNSPSTPTAAPTPLPKTEEHAVPDPQINPATPAKSLFKDN